MTAVAVDAEVLPASERWRILLYGGVLVLLVTMALPAGGLLQLPVLFFLKNRLHLTAPQVANFNVLAGIPLYLSFLPGFLRDRWSPFRAGDRGHLMLFGGLACATFAAFAFMPPVYPVLLFGIMAVTVTILMVASAVSGLVSTISQKHVMSGRASSVFNFALLLPAVISYGVGGFLSGLLEGQNSVTAARVLFLGTGAIMALIALLAAIGPKWLFAAAGDHEKPTESIPQGFVRLLKYWPVYPAVLIQLLWQFAPGFGTPLRFHLANALHASDAQEGLFYAIFGTGFLPTFFLYGWLCHRMKLSWLLWLGAILAVPQMAPLLFVHSVKGAFVAAAIMGLLGGIGQAAFMDLAIRSCPNGLQGTMMMLITTTAYWLPVQFGDVWGAHLYASGGFNTAVFATIGVYAMILPVLLLVPGRLTNTTDGQTLSTAHPRESGDPLS